MQLSTYLHFSGNCEEAFKFYETCFGVKIPMTVRYSDAPGTCDGLPDEWKSKIMHTRIDVGGTMLMGADSPPAHQEPMKGFSVSVAVADPAEGKRIFEALSEGGNVFMPYGETFWALGFGMAVDKFGVNWMVNSERPR